VSRHGYNYLLIVLQHHKHGSPPRVTPPRSRLTRATPPLPDLTTHVASDGYAFVIGNLNKHKLRTTPRSRPDTQLCQFTQPISVKYACINVRPTPDPPRSRRTRAAPPLFPFTHLFSLNSVCINAELPTYDPTTTRCTRTVLPPPVTSPCARGPTLAGALFSNGSPGLPLYIYIYIYIG
jgi:hypothetical protein